MDQQLTGGIIKYLHLHPSQVIYRLLVLKHSAMFSVGTLPVTAPRAIAPGAIGYEPNPTRLEMRGS
eukprot:1988738-Amphidinium_carterae.1